MWDEIAEQIRAATGSRFTIEHQSGVGGGCINSAYRLEGGGCAYFVKINDGALVEMFQAEAEGLTEMAESRSIRVPEPVCWGVADNTAYLVMEHINMGGSGGMDRFGSQLATMHRKTSAQFGWRRDNTIGSTPQINTPVNDWTRFWLERRLGFQLELAARNGHRGKLQEKGAHLMERLPDLFDGYRPLPSLLHGDLWSGNYAIDRSGDPVIFDPAVYYGDREADLAMTELFGGFGRRFYDAYEEAWPLDAGYATRKVLYNLYHIVNHLNLFGGGYGSQAEGMMDRLLSEIR